MTRTLEPRLLSLNVIAEQVETPLPDRTMTWLEDSLQAAIELELATLPPYLCGWWSIAEKGDHNPAAAELMYSVIREEMLHLGLACNMLKAIGGQPRIIRALHPYPGKLPGGVLDELTVQLSALTPRQVEDVYLAIEAPEKPIQDRAPSTKVTIGQFYQELWLTFDTIKPKINEAGQLTSSIGLTKLKTLADVQKAIRLIREQGEGTPTDRGAPSSHDELAHYYRFNELHTGRKYVQDPKTRKWDLGGEGTFPFPTVIYPMATLPDGGWNAPPAPVQKKLDEFNGAFLAMLGWLESAWAQGSQIDLRTAVGFMGKLGDPAVALMRMKIASGETAYGPDFRALPHWTRDIAPALGPIAAGIKTRYGIDAGDYASVKGKAAAMEKDMVAGAKPFDGAWTRAQTLIFTAWRETGFPK